MILTSSAAVETQMAGLLEDGAPPIIVAVNLKHRGFAPSLLHYFLASIPTLFPAEHRPLAPSFEQCSVPDFLPGLIYRDRLTQIFTERRQKFVGEKAVLADVAAHLFSTAHTPNSEWGPIYAYAARDTLERHGLLDSDETTLHDSCQDVQLTGPEREILTVLRRQIRRRLVREARERMISSVNRYHAARLPEGVLAFQELALRHPSSILVSVSPLPPFGDLRPLVGDFAGQEGGQDANPAFVR